MLDGLCVIVTGSPIDGLRIIGPFKNGDDAMWWADRANLEADWWLTELCAKEAWEQKLVTLNK